MNKVLEYILRSRDETGKGAKSAENTVQRVSRSILGNLANIKAGWDMLGGVVRRFGAVFRRVWSSVLEAFRMETMTVQFAVLLKNIDAARERMKDLTDFSASTSFQLDGIVVASRHLHVFSDGALGGVRSLKMIGDAASAVGRPIQELGFWVGRVYAAISGGKPFGEAAMRLYEIGVMTPQVARRMEELEASGARASEVFAVLEERLLEFEGAAQRMSQTGDGLISTLKDNWTLSVAEFGKVFVELAKNEIGYLIARMKTLRDDGTIEKWATSAKAAIQPLVEMVSNLFDGQSRGASMTAAWDYLRSVFDYGADMLKAAGDYIASTIKTAITNVIREATGRGAVPQTFEDAYDSPSARAMRMAKAIASGTVAASATQREQSRQAAREKWEAEHGTTPAERLAEAKQTASERFAQRHEDGATRLAAIARDRRARAVAEEFVGPPLPPGYQTEEERAEKRQRDIAMDEAGEAARMKKAEAAADAEKVQAMKARQREVARDLVTFERELDQWRKRGEALGDQRFVMGDVDARIAAQADEKAKKRDEQQAQDELRRAREAQARGVKVSARRQALIDMEDERVRKLKDAQEMEAFQRARLDALFAEQQALDAAIKARDDKQARDIATIADKLDKNLQVGP